MVNLLPHTGREGVHMEYRFRLAALAALFIAALSAVASACLLPAYFFAWVARNDAKSQQQVVEQSLSTQNLSDAATAGRDAAALLSAVRGTLGVGRPSAVIEALAAARVSGVTVTHLDYKKVVATTTVNVLGTAATRDALLSYKQSLLSVPGVASVDLPIGDLAKPSDIPYEFTVSYAAPAAH